jgi:hypothetical protein
VYFPKITTHARVKLGKPSANHANQTNSIATNYCITTARGIRPSAYRSCSAPALWFCSYDSAVFYKAPITASDTAFMCAYVPSNCKGVGRPFSLYPIARYSTVVARFSGHYRQAGS